MNDACYHMLTKDASESSHLLPNDDSPVAKSNAGPSSQLSQDQSRLVEKLQSELDQLRRSTRVALEQSWQEVESLQQKYAEEVHRADRLERDLEESRTREESWRVKYEETRIDLLNEARRSSFVESIPDSTKIEKLHGMTENGFHSGTDAQGSQGRQHRSDNSAIDPQAIEMMKSFKFSCEDWAKFLQAEAKQHVASTSLPHSSRKDSSISSTSKTDEATTEVDTNSKHVSNPWFSLRSVLDNNKNEKHRKKELKETKRLLETSLATLEHEKDAIIKELEEKISSRDSVIDELDRIAAAQEEDLLYVAQETDKLKKAFCEREMELEREVAELRGKIHEKKALIKKQVKRFEECQEYIKELAAELERVYKEQDGQ